LICTLHLRPGLAAIGIALLLSACRQPRLPGGGVPAPGPIPAETSSGCEPGQYLDEAFRDVKVKRNVEYSRVEDASGSHVLKMDVYTADRDPERRRPAIVWVHGGNFISGDRRQLSEYARGFASRGYVAAAIDYRLLHKPGVPNPQAQEAAQSDAQAAVRFLRARAAEFSLDPERIVIAGFSAGSITAFNVAYRGEFIGDNTAHSSLPHTVAGVVGLDGFSAFDDVQPYDPPFILFRASGGPSHGETSVLTRLIESADAAGVPYDIQFVKHARHNDLIKRPFRRSIAARAASFLRRNVACR
jgi:dienelactone hydrolase